jgi:hypothetical protein
MWALAKVETFNSDDDLLSSMVELADKEQLSLSEQIPLLFGLGKAMDDIKEYDRAFAYWKKANNLKRQTFTFDIRQQEKNAALVCRFFDDIFAKKIWQGSENTIPLLVTGMPRSGTTLLEQILTSHQDIAGAGETQALPKLAQSGARWLGLSGNFPQYLLNITETQARKLGDRYVENLKASTEDNTAKHIVDKQLYNIFLIPMLFRILPQAKVVVVKRHPLDVCLSCYATLFSGGQLFSYDLHELGKMYKIFDRLLHSWKSNYGQRILVVSYEEMINDLSAQTRQILKFVDMPWDEACLDFHRNSRRVETASSAQVRQPLYRSSVGRWHAYAYHLHPLRQTLGESVVLRP